MKEIIYAGVSADDHIKATAKEVFNLLYPEIQKLLGNNQPNKYYSADQICEMLGISKPTIHEWRRRGILRVYRLGSRVYYKWEDVENAMIIND